MQAENIRYKIRSGEYRLSDHAVRQMIKRSIARHDLEEAVLSGEIIEDYPEDKYSPSCLIYGLTKTGRNLHVQLSCPPTVIIITVYEPDAIEWLDCRIRRNKS